MGATVAVAPQSIPLTNGMMLHAQTSPQYNRSNISIILPISPAEAGVASLLPSVLLEGSPQTKQLIEQLTRQGIEATVMNVGDKMVLSVSGPRGQDTQLAQRAIQILTLPLQPMGVEPWTFNALKGNLLQNMQKGLIMPDVKLSDAIGKTLYGPIHPYGKSLPDTINATKTQTIDSFLSAYQQALGNPQQLQALMVSQLDGQQQVTVLNQAIGQANWFNDPMRKPLYPITLPPPPLQATGTGGATTTDPMLTLLADETLDRAHVIQAWKAPTLSDPDYPAFLMLFSVLNGFSGRFFESLRTQRGLVYSARQNVQTQQQAAHYTLSTEVDFDKLPQCLSAIDDVINSVVQTPIQEAELTRGKKEFILNTRSNIMGANGLADFYLSRLAVGAPTLMPNTMLDRIMQVTPADLQRVAQKVFQSGQSQRVVGVIAPQAQLSQVKQWANTRSTSPKWVA
jgi:zinc protease